MTVIINFVISSSNTVKITVDHKHVTHLVQFISYFNALVIVLRVAFRNRVISFHHIKVKSSHCRGNGRSHDGSFQLFNRSLRTSKLECISKGCLSLRNTVLWEEQVHKTGFIQLYDKEAFYYVHHTYGQIIGGS